MLINKNEQKKKNKSVLLQGGLLTADDSRVFFASVTRFRSRPTPPPRTSGRSGVHKFSDKPTTVQYIRARYYVRFGMFISSPWRLGLWIERWLILLARPFCDNFKP